MTPTEFKQPRTVRSGDLAGDGCAHLRQKLLTGAQRKALEFRVRSHAHRLELQIQRMVHAEPEPANVTKARRLIDKYEEDREEKVNQIQSGITCAAKQVVSNLLFDSVESCLIQVEEFEKREVITGDYEHKH